MIGLTFAIAFLALCTVVVGILQWRVMSGQLGEMKSGGTDTHDLAVAAGQQAQAALGQMERLKELVLATQSQNAVLSDQMKASQADAAKALNASINASRNDQRAWVGITEAATPAKIGEGEKFNFSIKLLNSGKSPSLDVLQAAGWRLLPTSEPLDVEREIQMRRPIREGVIQPGGSRILGTTVDKPITKQQSDGIANGSMTFYVFGKITYSDVFNIRHWTTFCVRLDVKDTLGFIPCDAYNDAN